jgi:hypothetical protein
LAIIKSVNVENRCCHVKNRGGIRRLTDTSALPRSRDNLLAGKLLLLFPAACHGVVQRRHLPVEIIAAKPNTFPGST